jgi:hypothetical protein
MIWQAEFYVLRTRTASGSGKRLKMAWLGRVRRLTALIQTFSLK